MDTLAILGGRPHFEQPLHVGRPNLGDPDRFRQRVEEILASRWLTNDGPMVRAFERRICEITGVRHCVAICNGTVALEIAIRALGLRGEVIVPSYTFVATAHALQWQEITPVFADIEPETHNIDPASVTRLITPRTSGIIGVHVWGRPCDTAAIEAIAREHGLKVLFDAAHAFGCSHDGRMIGHFGACEVLSFHATKFVNSFEGGAIVTNSDELAAQTRLMRNFGFVDYDKVIYLGVNGKMTEICAAMGLTSLESMDDLIAINRENHQRYTAALIDLPGIDLLDYRSHDRRNYHYVVVQVDPSRSPLSRDDFVEVLHAENVLARKYFWPGCHRMHPYDKLFPNAHLLLPNTEAIAATVMVLPTGQTISSPEISAICRIIRLALAQPEAVKQAVKTNRRAPKVDESTTTQIL